MTESTSDKPQKVPTDKPGAPDIAPDVQSDPARDASDQGDWTGEGGATTTGAATNADPIDDGPSQD